jgi:hypothetical protein
MPFMNFVEQKWLDFCCLVSADFLLCTYKYPLFFVYLNNHQSVGFTCGMDDMLIAGPGESQRSQLLSQTSDISVGVAAEFTSKAKEDREGIVDTLGVLLRR